MSSTNPDAVTAPPASGILVPRSLLQRVLLLAPLLYLWFRLVNNLRTEWETNPQYSYGYIVPFLCLGLIFQRWAGRGQLAGKRQNEESSKKGFGILRSPWSRGLVVVCVVSLAFFYLPTRLVELATPEWRPIQWSLGILAVGLTLITIYLGWGRDWLRKLAFPVCFFLVAIPWPTLIEQPIIQSLTRINAGMVIEVMGVIGIPALRHGNVIEVATGVVGIDEACSGIRSFQSSIMISLFLGALYDLTFWRRVMFVPIGFLLSMVFNLARTSFLTWIAAKQGVAAINKYHDPAGLWILVGCTAGLWLAGLVMKGKKDKAASGKQKTVNEGPTADDIPRTTDQTSEGRGQKSIASILGVQYFSVILLTWLVLVEVGAQAWYRTREANLPKSPEWTVTFPTNNATFKELPMAPATFNLLRFDEGKQGSWMESDDTMWSAFYFDWHPGRVAGYLAKRHTPEICMPASGREMLSGPELMVLKIHGLALPVRRYRFGPEGNSLHVYHCRWEAGATESSFVQHESARFNLVRAIWAGRGNQGQKIIEFIISGTEDPEVAKAMFVKRLEEMIKVEGLSAQAAEAK